MLKHVSLQQVRKTLKSRVSVQLLSHVASRVMQIEAFSG